MQKKILIPLVLIFAVSGVALGINFSNPNYLPDTVDFPRIPMGSGTIGEVIGKILGTNDLGNYTLNGGNGDVQNTQMLSGTTASGYLKINNCTSNTEVWNSFDSNGKANCATKSTTLAYYGQISEQTGTAKIYRLGTTSAINANIGTALQAGDIIKTDGSSSLTIAFIDTSILRLDENTTASLDISTIGTEPNKQIASLIIESGQVWGRILSPGTPTSTGYSLGSGDVVAGVRGTSIAIFKGPGITSAPTWDGPQNKWILTPISASTDIAVVHSRLPANITTGVAILTMKDGTKKIMNPGEKVQYNTTAGTLNTLVSPSSTSIANFYANTIWIRDNTKKDLDYMKTLSGTAIPTTIGSINRSLLIGEVLPTELLTSTPQDDGEKNALCDNNNTQKTYWNTLSGTTYDKCRSELAFADFTTNINPLIFSGTSISFTSNSPSSATKIGKYINITLNGRYKLCATFIGGSIGQRIAGFSGSTWTGEIKITSLPSTYLCSSPFVLNGGYNNLHIGGNSTFFPGSNFTGTLTKIEIQNAP